MKEKKTVEDNIYHLNNKQINVTENVVISHLLLIKLPILWIVKNTLGKLPFKINLQLHKITV